MASVSMDGYLAIVSPHLPPSLVSPEALERIHAVATKLPPCSLAGLELRLRHDRPEVDFFVRLAKHPPVFDSALLAHPVWHSAHRMCQRVSSPSEAFHDQVRFVFLEFDLDVPPPEIPVPALFFELHTDRIFSTSDLVTLASATIESPGPDGRSEAVERCLGALPDGAYVAHMAVMPARPGSAMRLVIDGVRTTAVRPYLQDIGWRDSSNLFAVLLDDIGAISDPVVMVDIDVDHMVRPKVGVEFYVRCATDNVPRWSALFDVLVNRGLASRAKTQALMSWPGYSPETAPNSVWPENLSWGDLLFRGSARSMFWRTLNHIKLAYQPGGEPEVKAYLGFGHNWFPTSAASPDDEQIGG